MIDNTNRFSELVTVHVCAKSICDASHLRHTQGILVNQIPVIPLVDVSYFVKAIISASFDKI